MERIVVKFFSTDTLEERGLSPLDFKIKWKLTTVEMSALLGVSEQTIKQWAAREGTKSHRNIPLCHKLHCECLDKLWSITVKTI